METKTDRTVLPVYGGKVRFRWDPFMFGIFNRWLYEKNRQLWLKVYSNLYSVEGQYEYTSNDCGLSDQLVIVSVNSITAAVRRGVDSGTGYTVMGIRIADNGCYMYRLDPQGDNSSSVCIKGFEDLWFHCSCFEGYEPLLSVANMYDSFTDPVILLMRYAADYILKKNGGNTSADVQEMFMEELSRILIKDKNTIRTYCNIIAHEPGIYLEGGALHDIIMRDDMTAFDSIGFSVSDMSPAEKYQEYIETIKKIFPDIREEDTAPEEGQAETAGASDNTDILEDESGCGCSLEHMPDGMWDTVYQTDCRIRGIVEQLVKKFDSMPEYEGIQEKEMIAGTIGRLLEIRTAFQKFRKDNRERLTRALSDAEGLLAGCQGYIQF